MSTPTTSSGVPPAPNHHADHPGFSGLGGLIAAVSFLAGRDRAAELAIELSNLSPGDRVVDVGCGPGVAVRRASERGATAIGIDPAAVMLRAARLRWRSDPRVEWRIGTAESLPVDDRSAEVVWSLATVHHWTDVDVALDEVHRILAPGGRFVALERRIHDTNAAGVASHGWTPAQAESLAGHSRRHGFTGVAVGTHPAGRGTLVSVVSHRPA